MHHPEKIILTCDPQCIHRLNGAVRNIHFTVEDFLTDLFALNAGCDYEDTLDNLADYVYGDIKADLEACLEAEEFRDFYVIDRSITVENMLHHLYAFLLGVAEATYACLPKDQPELLNRYRFVQMVDAGSFLIEYDRGLGWAATSDYREMKVQPSFRHVPVLPIMRDLSYADPAVVHLTTQYREQVEADTLDRIRQGTYQLGASDFAF